MAQHAPRQPTACISTREVILLVLRSVQYCNWGFASSALWGCLVPDVSKEHREAASRPWRPESSRITVLLLQTPVLIYFLLMFLISIDISCLRNRMWVLFKTDIPFFLKYFHRAVIASNLITLMVDTLIVGTFMTIIGTSWQSNIKCICGPWWSEDSCRHCIEGNQILLRGKDWRRGWNI